MNPEPLISCILIFLNAERYMGEAIGSIFNQTYSKWELLLVDDGSDDSSTAIARQFAERNPTKVRYLEHEHHQNKGMSASRNLGVRHAKGEYIAFLDADDVWLPNKLEDQVAVFYEHPEAGMVYGRTLIWYSWKGKSGGIPGDHTIDLGVQPGKVIKPPGLYYHLLKNKVQTPTTCNFMVRRDVFESSGGFEDAFRGMYEDQVFYAKVFIEQPVYVSGSCWAKYRQHPGSCSSITAGAEDYYEGRLIFLRWLEQYLNEKKIDPKAEVFQALRKEIWLCRHPNLYRFSDFLGASLRKVLSRSQNAQLRKV